VLTAARAVPAGPPLRRSRARARRSPRHPVALATSALLGDRLSGRAWVGIGLSVAAVVLTVAKGPLATLLSRSMNRGDLISLLSQTAWIAYSLHSRAAASTLRRLGHGGRERRRRSCSTQRARSRSAICGSIRFVRRLGPDGRC